MSYHEWGDDWPYWKDLDNCVSYVYTYSRRWGRLGGQVKEKFGSLRFYASFGYLSLHTLTYPGYVYSQFPKWLWKLDIDYIGPILRFFFEKPFVKWQMIIYNRLYQNCLKKWPHLRAEILCGADYPELIKGATRIEETDKEISTIILGWQGEEIGRWTSYK